MNLFYKIHLQAFNVISVVLYHSGPTFVQVLYSSLDAFVVDASDYSDHLIRHLLNASEAFPTEWFLRNKSKSGGLSPSDFDLFPKLKKPLHGKRFRSIEEVSNEVT
jgi:homogentisate 1,2-dioxygenase